MYGNLNSGITKQSKIRNYMKRINIVLYSFNEKKGISELRENWKNQWSKRKKYTPRNYSGLSKTAA